MSLSEIDPSSLADILRRSNGRLRKLLIVDCRCFIDYNDSHIRSAVNAFYSKLVRRRLQENKVCATYLLQQLLSCGGDAKARVGTLSEGEEEDDPQLDLVLYDQQTQTSPECDATTPCDLAPSSQPIAPPTAEKTTAKALVNGHSTPPPPPPNNCPMARLKRTMRCKQKSDSSLLAESTNFIALLLEKLRKSEKFSQVLVLKGGFVDFKARYPELCEGAATEATVEGDAMASQRPPGLCPSRPPLTSLSQPCLPVSSEGPTKILPFLYLGSQQDALNSETLKKQGIDYVINLSLHCPRPDHFVEDEHFLRIPVNDSYQEKLLPYFDKAFEFLDKVREANSAVLIHCLAGISRSPTMAIAYIMKQCNMTTDEAYTYVKAKRPSISPNFNFMGQLLEYERQLKERRSKDVAQMLMRQPQVSTNKSSGSQTSQPITCALSDSETITAPSKVADRESNSSDTDISLSSSTGSEHMRRCLSCPVKMQKSVSSSELRRRDDWLDLDHQSPASTTNANGKRQMRPSKSMRSEDSTYSSASSTLEQEMDSEEADGPETMRDRLESSKMAATAPWPVVERPRGLGGLKARRALNIPQPVKEDLPSPSTELSKLSFSQSFCRTAEPLVTCCPGSSLARSPTVEKVSFPGREPVEQHSAQVQSTCAPDATQHRTTVFATNPFFAAFSAANAATIAPPASKSESPSHSDASTISVPTPPLERRSDVVVTDQPRSSHTSAENPMFPSCSTSSKEQPTSDAAAPMPQRLVSRLAHFLRRGPWTVTGAPSVPVNQGASLTTAGYFAGSKSRCQMHRSSTVGTLASSAPPPLGIASSTAVSAATTTTTPAAAESLATDERTTGPPKSQSESARLYSLCEDLDSPESGFVESPLRESLNESSTAPAAHPYGLDPERESIGSASSLEIIVN